MADVNVTSITYNGKEIKSLEAGKTGTVRCKGKKMKTDLVVKAANIAAPKLQEKTATANGTVKADSGYDGLSKVEVNVEGEVLPKYDGEVIIEGEPESGGGDGGSAEFNIAYGDTAPTDTSKLWVKANEPEAVSVTPTIVASEIFEMGYAALPTAAYNMTSAVVGTKVYLFGGLSGTGNTYLTTIYVFDTETNTIEKLSTTLPNKAHGVAAAVVGTKIYLFGGKNSSSSYLNTINVFDTETNTIEKLSTTLPSATFGIASAVVGTKVYLIGGAMSYLSTINVFDTENNTITTVANLPRTNQYSASALIGSKVYLFGGTYSSSKIEVFDIETYTTETLSTTISAAYGQVTSALIGTKVYLFGGQGTSSGSSCISTIEVFDTETNTIEALSTELPTAAYGIAAAVVGTKVYLFGGYGGGSLSTIYEYKGQISLATNNMIIEASVNKNRFNLLPNVELGVNNVYLGNAEGNGEKVEAYLHNGTEWVEV